MTLQLCTIIGDAVLYNALINNASALDAHTAIVIFFAIAAINYIGFTGEKFFK